MKIRRVFVSALMALLLSAVSAAQQTSQSGFVITLKNGSSIRGSTLSRDESSGTLRLTMTFAADAPKSYAVIAPDDVSEIRSSSSDADSIRIKLKGGSDLRCKEFALNGDTVSVKLGSATKIDVLWSDIESISFVQ